MDSKTPLKELLALVVERQPGALQEFRFRVVPRLRAIAREYLRDHDEGDREFEEVLADLVDAISQQLPHFIWEDQDQFDTWLVTQLKRQVLAHLMNLYHLRLLAIIRRALPDYLRLELAEEDIYQQVAIVVQNRAETFEWHGEAAFIGYLATIAVRQIRDRTDHDQRDKRGGGRRIANEIRPAGSSDAIDLIEQNYLSLTTPSVRAAREELLEKLNYLTRGILTQQEQMILAMYYVEDYRMAEIADRLDLSLANVKAICARARKKLAKALGEKSQWMSS